MNSIGILCLVSLALLTWVIFLKLEIDTLQQQLGDKLDPTPREDRPMQGQGISQQKGLRSFTIKEG